MWYVLDFSKTRLILI